MKPDPFHDRLYSSKKNLFRLFLTKLAFSLLQWFFIALRMLHRPANASDLILNEGFAGGFLVQVT